MAGYDLPWLPFIDVSNLSSMCTVLLTRASCWLLALHHIPPHSPSDSFPSVPSLPFTLGSHAEAHHIKAHCEGQQLPSFLFLGEKGGMLSVFMDQNPPLSIG